MPITKKKNNDHRKAIPLVVAAFRRLILFLLLLTLLPLSARASDSVTLDTPPSWLEPRGLSIVDLVGLVPEEHLSGAIVRYAPGLGLVLYEQGHRDGDRVTVRVRYVTQWPGVVLCLGKPGERDEWPVAVPASTVRIFEGGVDVTGRLAATFTYFPAGFVQPIANTSYARYPEYTGVTQINASGEAVVPGNTGCQLILHNTGSDLSAEFTFWAPPVIEVQTLGVQSGQFQSYIGPGSAGLLDSLRNQMRARYSDRHTDLRVTPPAGTNYVLVRYPLTPVDPFAREPYYSGAGTYRVRRVNSRLSVDHINTMGIPYYGQWQDADQSGGSSFLPYFTDSIAVTAPEYFLPEGLAYNACMTYGGCSSALLDAIYRAQMTMQVYFYEVRPASTELIPVPLRMVGPSWVAASSPQAAQPDEAPAEMHRYWLPMIASGAVTPPLNPAGCPCGWFTPDGRMVGFHPGQ